MIDRPPEVAVVDSADAVVVNDVSDDVADEGLLAFIALILPEFSRTTREDSIAILLFAVAVAVVEVAVVEIAVAAVTTAVEEVPGVDNPTPLVEVAIDVEGRRIILLFS